MKRAKIVDITDGLVPDLKVVIIENGLELIVDPFVGEAFILPEFEDAAEYRQYIADTYIGQIIMLNTDCLIASHDGITFLPNKDEIHLLIEHFKNK